MAEDVKYGPLFFLGAGASVAAGVPATFELVDCFLEELKSRNETKRLEFLEKILKTLKESELGQKGVDVELLLEALGQLEAVSECIPLKFFKKGECILGNNFESEATELRKELQNIIKKKGLVSKSKIQYLKDLLMFTESNPLPLDIFSVNYDICIEQFCDTFEKEYVDGFYLKWEPESLQRKDVSIRLYKVHGSITWYETERGSLVKLPIKSEAAEIELITGEKASALILYPMRKVEYSEPLMSLLMKLSEKLSISDFVFVIGYSFRDNQLRRIFWNAAKKNKKLVLFLVTPSAHEIYEKRLRNYEFDIPSDLAGRVICLPYRFEKILPLLSDYLRNATNGLRMLEESKKSETLKYGREDWWRCLPSLIDCEHTDKVEEVLQKGAWEDLVKNGPLIADTIKSAFKAFLTSVLSDNATYTKAWVTNLLGLFSLFVDPTTFHIEIEPTKIERIKVGIYPEIKKDAKLNLVQIIEAFDSMLSLCNQKSSLVKDESSEVFSTISDGIKKFRKHFLIRYFSIDEYLQLRKDNFPTETGQISSLIEQYIEESEKGYPEDLRSEIPDIIAGIEEREFSLSFSRLKAIFETAEQQK
jgi:hypothetical protein